MDREKSAAFASDNAAGVHPEVMHAINACNYGYGEAYGHDPVTEDAKELFRKHFGRDLDTFFVFGGTAANVIALSACLTRIDGIICASTSHLANDECGAPEKFLGAKLITVPSEDGKIYLPDIVKIVYHYSWPHNVRPRILSITQPTELGTLYTLEEIKLLVTRCHQQNMLVHMDGARLANAAAALQCSLAETSTELGIDALSFGGTKNGLMGAEAVLIKHSVETPDVFSLGTKIRDGDQYSSLQKQAMQLGSKMRFVSAQFLALLQNDLWRRNAENANAMAQRLEEGIRQITRSGGRIGIKHPVQSNAVFVKLPPPAIERLSQEYFFYPWEDEHGDLVRWMTSWSTTKADVDRFLTAIGNAVM